MAQDEAIGHVLSPVKLSEGGRIELTEYGEELYDSRNIAAGSLLAAVDHSGEISHILITTNVTEKNAIYEERSVFQALRKVEPRTIELGGVDMRQVIMDFGILAEISDGVSPPTRPPSPGSPVYRLEARLWNKLFGKYAERTLRRLKGEFSPEDKELLKFGEIVGSNRLRGAILAENINMHLGIVGTTGSGKSFTAGALIEFFGRLVRNLNLNRSMIVFDVHGEYVDTYGESEEIGRTPVKLGFNYHDLIGLDFAIEHLSEVIPLYTASEFSSLVKYFYPVGSSGVYWRLIEDLYDGIPDLDLEPLYVHLHEAAKIDDLRERRGYLISKIEEYLAVVESRGKYARNTVRAAKRALEAFINAIVEYLRLSDPRGRVIGPKELVRRVRKGKKLILIDLTASGSLGVDVTIKDLAISFILRVLYYLLADKFYGTNKRVIFLIDEAQTYIPAPGYDTGATLTKSIVRRIASQGRKFGFSLILISQRPSFLDRHVFSLVNSLIIHRTALGDAQEIVKVFGLPKSMAAVLANQRTGEAFVHGLLFPMDMRIRIVRGIDRKIVPSRDRGGLPGMFSLGSPP